jgi:hypothetical protein
MRLTQPDKNGKVRLVTDPPHSADEILTPMERAKVAVTRAVRNAIRAEYRRAVIAQRLDRLERAQGERRTRRFLRGGK